MIGYFYIGGCLFFTVYGQLIIKWRVSLFGNMPEDMSGKFLYLFNVLSDPYIISGLFSAFLASLFWIAAMTKFDLSFAYPFMSLAFVIVLLLSNSLFSESIGIYKLLGMIFIVLGVYISSRASV